MRLLRACAEPVTEGWGKCPAKFDGGPGGEPQTLGRHLEYTKSGILLGACCPALKEWLLTRKTQGLTHKIEDFT